MTCYIFRATNNIIADISLTARTKIMTKINLRTAPLIFSLVLLSAIANYSCKRDSDRAMSQLNQALIGSAKQFYERETILFETRNRQVLSAEAQSVASSATAIVPMWYDAAIETTKSGKKIVTVPIPEFILETKTNAYARKIVFSTLGESITEGQIVEVFSDPSEIRANGKRRINEAMDGKLSGFTGAVMTYNLNYLFKEGRYYEKGKARKGIAKIAKGKSIRKQQLALPGSANVAGGVAKLSVTPGSISGFTPEFEGQDCENYYLVYIERDSFGNIVYWENLGFQYTICKSTSADSPYPGGSNTDIYVDCNGDVYGSAYQDACGDCIGGNTGLEACKDFKDLLDSFPCAKNLVLQMPGLKSDIATKIKTLFNKNNMIDLVFEPKPSLKNTATDGEFIGYAGTPSRTAGTYRIGLNPDVLNNASKEYILVTLYHEALHAYLDHMKSTLTAAQFNAQFAGYNVNGGRLLMSQDPQHWPLSYVNFINGLKDVILEFNPSYDPVRAAALAKGGIIVLNTAEINVNKQERNTNDPINNPGYTGTKCP